MKGTKNKYCMKHISIVIGIVLTLILAGIGNASTVSGKAGSTPCQNPVWHATKIDMTVGQRVSLHVDKIPLSFRISNPGYSTDSPKILNVNEKGTILGVNAGRGTVYAGTGKLRLKVANVQVFPKKIIYLTFDDGPSKNVTPKILKILKENKVPGTFFLVGQYVNYYPDLVTEIDRLGNAIGVHSDTHKYDAIYKSPKTLIKDINTLDGKLEKILNKKAHLYRFPGGSTEVQQRLGKKQKEDIIRKLNQQGYRCFDWNASLGDADGRGKSAEALFLSAKKTIGQKNRVILLSHDMGLMKNTPKAIEKVIHYYKKKGYRFDTLDHYQGQYLFP